MKAKTLLTAARRILIEKEWVQGSYSQTVKPDGTTINYRLSKGRLVPANEWAEPAEATIDADGKVIHTSQIGAVCAIGAMELALANKDYEGDMGSNVTDPAVTEARRLLERAIIGGVSTPTDPYVLERYREYLWDEFDQAVGYNEGCTDEQLDEWVAEQAASGDPQMTLEEFNRETSGDYFDGVEEWNDTDGRTKREVIEAFDRAIALA